MPAIAQVFAWAFRPTQFMSWAARKYGETFTIRFPGFPEEVLYSNPRDIKEIFTGPVEGLHAGKGNEILEPLVGRHSLFLLDGKRHMEQRKLLLPPFHGERMHSYCEQMRKAADVMIDSLPTDQTVGIHAYTKRFTLDIILKIVLGISEDHHFMRLRKLLGDVLDGASSPLLLAKMLQVDLGPLTAWRRLSRALIEIEKILFQLVEERRASNDANQSDILSMLISTKHEDGRSITFDELRDEMMTILVAGGETTSSALAWAVFHILKTPGVLNKIREELTTVLDGDDISAQHLPKLNYLEAVVKETLRLSPVIPTVGRALQRPMTIGGHDLPAGVVVVPCIYLTHRREDIYPDPLMFKPERFQNDGPGSYEFFPFGGGIRRCIGAAFAMYEMKILLAQVALRTDLDLPANYQGRVTRRSVTFTPEKGMLVNVKLRKKRDPSCNRMV
ncbi:MAG: cytochrome P450 [Opitutae bacterium]|nr:cytochrome P450 [Opitutae bacterium]